MQTVIDLATGRLLQEPAQFDKSSPCVLPPRPAVPVFLNHVLSGRAFPHPLCYLRPSLLFPLVPSLATKLMSETITTLILRAQMLTSPICESGTKPLNPSTSTNSPPRFTARTCRVDQRVTRHGSRVNDAWDAASWKLAAAAVTFTESHCTALVANGQSSEQSRRTHAVTALWRSRESFASNNTQRVRSRHTL